MRYFLLCTAVCYACIINGQQTFIDKNAIDPSVKPGQDFFTYANGSWLKTNEIPSTESSWGVFTMVQKKTRGLLKDLVIENSSLQSDPGSVAQKLKDFYNSGMDSAAIEKAGITPILTDIK